MPDKSLARNLTPRPGGLAQMAAPEQKGIWSMLEQALQGYWDRQGKLAQEGLTMADQGARQMREGDPSGALGMFAGPVNYLMSPVSALVPTGEEIDTARDLPEWSKPLARAASHTALLAIPGPDLGPVASSVGNTARRIGDDAAIAFGTEVPEGVTVYGAGPILKKPGLGRGMADLAGDATDAELAALKARLEAEAAQTGTGAAPAARDQALLNLTSGGAGQTPGPASGSIVDDYMASLGDHEATAAIVSKLQTMSLAEVKALATEINKRTFRPAPGSTSTKTSMINSIESHSRQVARDKEIAEYIRAGEPPDREAWAAAYRASLKKPPGQSPAPQAGGGAGQTPGPAEGIIAYHGSPHTFDKFDMSKIGTGEGAQAYGHGLYFAESPAVAKSYQEKLAQNNQRVAAPQPQPKTGNPFIDANAPILEPDPTRPGSMYQVRINAKPDEFLNWDAPLSQQPAQVRSTLTDMIGRTPPVDHPGSTIYNRISEELGGARGIPNEQMTEALKARGIKGIRYKDAGSRSGEGGTYNYVVFDDKIIDILKRYGIPMTVGVGGGVVVTGANMPPDLAAQMGAGAS